MYKTQMLLKGVCIGYIIGVGTGGAKGAMAPTEF